MLHKRLQEERQRLGLNQDEFGEFGGVKRRAQINYESGERCPDGHYYEGISAAGADVKYIITGQRDRKVAETPPGYDVLPVEKRELLEQLDRCAPELQEAIKNLIRVSATQPREGGHD
jgi:transcriptional regulator with XRE-family HTH domain